MSTCLASASSSPCRGAAKIFAYPYTTIHGLIGDEIPRILYNVQERDELSQFGASLSVVVQVPRAASPGSLQAMLHFPLCKYRNLFQRLQEQIQDSVYHLSLKMNTFSSRLKLH